MSDLSRWVATKDSLVLGLGISSGANEARFDAKVGSDGRHHKVLRHGEKYYRPNKMPSVEWYLTDYDLLKRVSDG